MWVCVPDGPGRVKAESWLGWLAPLLPWVWGTAEPVTRVGIITTWPMHREGNQGLSVPLNPHQPRNDNQNKRDLSGSGKKRGDENRSGGASGSRLPDLSHASGGHMKANDTPAAILIPKFHLYTA